MPEGEGAVALTVIQTVAGYQKQDKHLSIDRPKERE